MRKIGRVLHISPTGKAVVKAGKVPRIGDIVVDEKKRQIGTVFDIIGPTSSPYVEVEVKIKDPQKIVEKVLYAISTSKIGVKGKA